MAEPAAAGKQLPANVVQLKTFKDKLEKNKALIQAALPRHMNPERFLRIATTTCARTPKIFECDIRTLVGAVIQCAQIGLEPDNVLGHAYLLPFYNTKKRAYDVQIIIGYKGLIELARRSGQVVDVSAHIVYENEKCELTYGTDEHIDHIPLPPEERGEKRIGAYARAKFKDGTIKVHWMWAAEILKARDSSPSAWTWDYGAKAWKVGPDGSRVLNPESIWVKWEDDMWIKTVIRHMAKFLPLSPEFQKAAAVDELGDAGLTAREINLDDLDDLTAFPVETMTDGPEDRTAGAAEAMRERLKAPKAEAANA